ncbi:hypothetical protein P170DRAFT_511072 [Aspergillus steynii IBT 23096]|uniref:Zn(2)-C6 fungal-type domain-containing protein n=1 Tax=Aspergillus steynii IBT 23096 TaxID=1392250 RepID=A0A2I2G6L5_9EURO|nr:uncharacterized protein P170DRAFT_511072 [Aspergillus steynii IBT 23096]PLB48515.1 hypothetical protein P170DRAFT_511072 [Aspergillus steynii IBT 23096]
MSAVDHYVMADTPTSKVSKTCDLCKARKVRCTRSGDDEHAACDYCITRKARCHYSYMKPPRKRKQRTEDVESPSGGSETHSLVKRPALTSPEPAAICPSIPDETVANKNSTRQLPPPSGITPSSLYVDHLLASRQTPARGRDEEVVNKVAEIFGPSSNISFFSKARVDALSARLGHTRLSQLLETIGTVANSRTKGANKAANLPFLRQQNLPPLELSEDVSTACIQAFFTHVHPVYPFLDQKAFEQRLYGHLLYPSLEADRVWSGLYYAVLALGCQYNDGGSFDPGKGQAWCFFERAMSCFSDIIFTKGSLMAIQALTAMAIFSTKLSAWQFEALLISEAARMAQNMGYNRNRGSKDNLSHRVFWVLYCLDKTSCFVTGRTSNIMDADIGCPIPYVPESIFGDYDWFLTHARYARLVSRIYSTIFSLSAAGNSSSYYLDRIQHLLEELESWKTSIPESYRPGEPLQARLMPGPVAVSVALHTQYYYYNALMTLSRTALYLGDGPKEMGLQLRMKRLLIDTACSILELTKYIEVASYTSLWVLAIMPLSALFILFDQAVHNPLLPQTNTYLALLDIATGHFSRLDYASQGTVPSSLLAEFAHIARQYIRDLQMKEFGRDRYQVIQTAQRRESHDASGYDQTKDGGVPNIAGSTIQPQIAALENPISGGFLGSQPLATPNPPINQTSGLVMQQYTHQEPNERQTSDASKQLESEKTRVGNTGSMSSQYEASALAMETISGAIASEEFQLLGIDVMDLFDTMNFTGEMP